MGASEPTVWGAEVLLYHKVDSTNTRAAALAGEPANDGLVLLADEQRRDAASTGGSGRARPARRTLSVLLFPPPLLRRPVFLAAWGCHSVCETIRPYHRLQARIKWPNDVLGAAARCAAF